MRLNEVKQDNANLDDDEFIKAQKTDTRRSRLTLEHLNKLRKMREVRKLEVEERKDLYKKIYQRPPTTM